MSDPYLRSQRAENSRTFFLPPYFFDVRDSKGLHRDDVDDEFVTFDEVRKYVQVLLPNMIRGELLEGELHRVIWGVRDEAGRVVYQGRIIYEGKRDPV